MVWDNKRLHPRLAALRIILFIFIQHYRHGVMCQRENVGRPYVLIPCGEGRSTLSVCHIHGLSFTPLWAGNGRAALVSLHCIVRAAFHVLVIHTFKLRPKCGHTLLAERGITQIDFAGHLAKFLFKLCGCHAPTIECLQPYREPCFEEHRRLVSGRKVELHEQCRVGVVGFEELAYRIVLQKIAVGHFIFKHIFQSCRECERLRKLVVEGYVLAH